MRPRGESQGRAGKPKLCKNVKTENLQFRDIWGSGAESRGWGFGLAARGTRVDTSRATAYKISLRGSGRREAEAPPGRAIEVPPRRRELKRKCLFSFSRRFKRARSKRDFTVGILTLRMPAVSSVENPSTSRK